MLKIFWVAITSLLFISPLNGLIPFETQELVDDAMYPRADLKDREVLKNISLTIAAYEGYCRIYHIKPLELFIQQLKAGKAKINLTGEVFTYFNIRPVLYSLGLNQTVVYLNLNYNFLGDTGAYEICEMIQKNKTLQHLDVGSCCIGNEGAEALRLAASKRPSLQPLELINLSPLNEIDEQQRIYLDACSKYRQEPDQSMILFFRGNCRNLKFPYFMTNTASLDGKAADNKTPAVLIGKKPMELLIFSEIIRNTSSIQQLLIADKLPLCPESEEFMASFASNRSISNLIIQAPLLEDSQAARLFVAIAGNQTIQALSIDYTGVSDTGMAALTAMLSRNRTIRYFRFAYNRNTEESSKNLIKTLYSDNNTIESLILKGITVTNDPNLALLRKKFPEKK